MRALLAAVALSLVSVSAMAAGEYLSFTGKATIEAVKAGEVKATVRLGDRTAPPANFKVGQVVPLVNGDEKEDSRKYAEQIAANAYGKVEINSIKVSKFEALSKKDQEEFAKYYSAEQIQSAKGVVTVIGIKFKN